LRNIVDRCHRVTSHLKWSVVGAANRVRTSAPLIALTFDDGPNPSCTPALLAVLQKFQARATFFMVGETACKHPELLEQVARAEHAIGNHSWDHPSFPLISRRERWRQLRACQRALSPHGQKIFRPPFGHQTIKSSLDAWLMGYQVVTWDVAARDWLDHEAMWMVDRVESQARAGSIILFHDALNTFLDRRYCDRRPMLEAVRLLLERMSRRYRFVTIPQLFKHGRANCQEWCVKGRLEVLEKMQEGDGRPWKYASRFRRGPHTSRSNIGAAGPQQGSPKRAVHSGRS
jgi:peptidoglycan/xylan/chitin deacetylase (PgdA/CDA1 family)